MQTGISLMLNNKLKRLKNKTKLSFAYKISCYKVHMYYYQESYQFDFFGFTSAKTSK